MFSVEIAEPLGPAELSDLLHRRVPVYDKDREGHYNLISALHKSLRGSDPQAALYYLARMLVAGEEPLYVLRRLTRAAVEDIGLADPNALLQCLAAKEMYDFLGSPEGEIGDRPGLPLSRHRAQIERRPTWRRRAAWRSAKETGSLMPPMHILNAPTKLMKDVGYGKDYAYDHNADEGFSGPGLLARGDGAAGLLRADRPRLRGAGAGTAGLLGEAAQRAATIGRRRGLNATSGTGSRAQMYQVDQGAYWQAQMMYWGPKILIAILILVVTWIVARAVKWVLQKAIDRSPALKKHVTGTPEETVGHQLGTIAKLIIWLVGIMAALQLPRGRRRSSRPINELVTEIFAFLPRLIGAGLIFFIGLIVARIVKRLVETVLIAANIDGLLARIGIGDRPKGPSAPIPTRFRPARRPARPAPASPAPPACWSTR